MEENKSDISLEQIREMDLVNYLSNLGHEPSRVRNNDFWYLSPLRQESEPSFKVNRRINRWYDHGLGIGGNLIDFAIRYQGCSISEFLEAFRNSPALNLPSRKAYPSSSHQPESRLQVLEHFSLRSDLLIRYIQDRRVSLPMADRYCREVVYEIGGNSYTGIGFANDSGGFEIRSPHYKLGNSPKDITSLDHGNREILVFEGFMDFLTFRTIHPDLDESKVDFLVLNSVSFFERARRKMEIHEKISLYLDRDRTGIELTRLALSLDSAYCDKSELYKNHKDLNEWSMNLGMPTNGCPARRLSK